MGIYKGEKEKNEKKQQKIKNNEVELKSKTPKNTKTKDENKITNKVKLKESIFEYIKEVPCKEQLKEFKFTEKEADKIQIAYRTLMENW